MEGAPCKPTQTMSPAGGGAAAPHPAPHQPGEVAGGAGQAGEDGPAHYSLAGPKAASSPSLTVSTFAPPASATSTSSPPLHNPQLAARHVQAHAHANIPSHPLPPPSSSSRSPSDASSDPPQDPATPVPLLGMRDFPGQHALAPAGASPFEASPSRPHAPPQPKPSHPPAGHQRNVRSPDGIPRQTVIKALASVARAHKPEALSLTEMLSTKSPLNPGSAPIRKPSSAPSQTLCDALNDMAHQRQQRDHAVAGRGPPRSSRTPTTALLGHSLQSPCFYHERFDDAVDINKVLEEIKNDQWMSHSRLVQTATGVREVSKQLQRRPLRRAVRAVMVVTKARDNQLVLLTRELALWLMQTPRYGSDLGISVYVDAKLRNSKRFDAPGILAENPRFQSMLKYWSPDLCWSQPEKFDLVLTLGGDGTVLFTSWLFQRIVPPVLSFSLGSLGFLTTFEFECYKDHLNRVMGEEGMRVNLRMRFTCTVYRNGNSETLPEEAEQFEVLNELVIDRGPSPYVSNLELYGDDELLTVVQADGCIFSTPTGSTAYSLSAGGSLVHPDIPAVLLTPICPHTLSFRPMVLSDTMLLRVSVPLSSRATAYCAFDGKGRVELKPGDSVSIAASQYPFPTVNRNDMEWFNSVSRTLRWNVRATTQKGFEHGSLAGDAEHGEQDSWDIDPDSACYTSEEGSVSASPVRRQMSLLGM